MIHHIGRECTITVGGRTYTLSRFTRRLMLEMAEWADSFLGNPLDLAADQLDNFPPELQDMIAEDALRRAGQRGSWFGPEFQTLLASQLGMRQMLGLLLRKHHPALTPYEVDTIYEGMVREHGGAYFVRRLHTTMGRWPMNDTEAEQAYYRQLGWLPADQPARWQPENWTEIDKALVKHYRMMPEDIDALTYTEIFHLFEALKEKEDIKLNEAQATVDNYRRLTPLQKLQLGFFQYSE